MSETSTLLEKWSDLIEANVVPSNNPKEQLAQLLENQEQHLTEDGTAQADIAQFTPILVPAVRRIFPNLLANEIVGVQALKTPTAYAFALRSLYGDGKGEGTSTTDRGTFDRGLTTGGATFTSVGLIFAAHNGTAATLGTNNILVAGVSGSVKYSEPGRALVTFASNADAITATTPGVSASGAVANTTVVAGFQNEIGYNLIFKNYTGPMTTADGEILGSAIKTVQIRLEKVQVEAKSRRLKAGYTLEMAQDFKNQFGMDAEKELINVMEYEVSAELDRELVDLINAKATVTPTWSYGGTGQLTAQLGSADGRWEAEKIRTLYNRLLREANQIALSTRRGTANFIIASSNVVAALETLQGFMYASVPGQVKPTMGVAKVGTLDGRFTVYMDTFAFTDYITLGFKGSGNMDSGIIYCPYVPLQMQKVVDPETFQPKIGFLTRDAIVGNLWGAHLYYRTFKVDFGSSSFGGGYFTSGLTGTGTVTTW
jgi:hypothetical protein